jgi:hypothetical protein
MDKLSKEELLAIIAKDNKKPSRKKAELTEDKRAELLDRLASMRETVKKNRDAKKAPEVEKDLDAIFEKKFSTKFEKIESVLSEVADTQKEMVRMKKEKAEAKKVAEKPAEPKAPEKSTELSKPGPPKPADPIPEPVSVMPPRNPNVFTKCRTRF